MVLLRQLLGDVLRRLRIRQGRTLREVSASARVSLGYLSEVERGRKEASSELLAAICAALDTPLSQVFREVSDNFALAELQQDAGLGTPREPVLREPVVLREHSLRDALREHSLREHGLRVVTGERVPVPGEAGDGATGARDELASVSDEFADHHPGFDGAGDEYVTDMVPV